MRRIYHDPTIDPLSEPTSSQQVKNLLTTSISQTTISLQFESASPVDYSGALIVMRLGSGPLPTDGVPVDGVDYTSRENRVFGTPSALIGTSSYVIFAGHIWKEGGDWDGVSPGTPRSGIFTVTGLSPNTTYYFRGFSYKIQSLNYRPNIGASLNVRAVTTAS